MPPHLGWLSGDGAERPDRRSLWRHEVDAHHRHDYGRGHHPEGGAGKHPRPGASQPSCGGRPCWPSPGLHTTGNHHGWPTRHDHHVYSTRARSSLHHSSGCPDSRRRDCPDRDGTRHSCDTPCWRCVRRGSGSIHRRSTRRSDIHHVRCDGSRFAHSSSGGSRRNNTAPGRRRTARLTCDSTRTRETPAPCASTRAAGSPPRPMC